QSPFPAPCKFPVHAKSPTHLTAERRQFLLTVPDRPRGNRLDSPDRSRIRHPRGSICQHRGVNGTVVFPNCCRHSTDSRAVKPAFTAWPPKEPGAQATLPRPEGRL